MKIAVISGSPKGQNSVTLQSVEWLRLKFPRHHFDVFHVGQRIKEPERKPEELKAVLDAIDEADALVWAFPVYYMLVPSQMLRFIELARQAARPEAFAEKPSFSLSTSVHFYDHTAHEFLRQVSLELGMKYFGFFSAGMEDLLQPKERQRLEAFFTDFEWAVAHEMFPAADIPAPRACLEPEKGLDPKPPSQKQSGKALVLTCGPQDGPAFRMARAFAAASPLECEITRLEELNMQGGCLGCLLCGWDNECVYKDGFREFFLDKTLTADAVVFAMPLSGGFFPSAFKTFLDRSFFRGHVPNYEGKPMVFLVAGDLNANPAAAEFAKAFAECGGARLTGAVCDCGDAACRTRAVEHTAHLTARAALTKMPPSPTYRSYASFKIFRDLIYKTPFVFRADYRFYSKRELLDYPNRDWKLFFRKILMALLMSVPSVRKSIQAEMARYMLAGHQAVLEKEKAGS